MSTRAWASGRSASLSTNCVRSRAASPPPAAGERKYTAVRAAVRGCWITVLITDITTARRLLDEP
ncbi:sugar-binding domain-containing protein [Streptomyces sp. NPDC005811]|uniref:sugar-binding domain-containing protein n=1 Tax=Streptomyces sp. NPDC005811 TaxID=3154565 RepID=UPI0034114C4D